MNYALWPVQKLLNLGSIASSMEDAEPLKMSAEHAHMHVDPKCKSAHMLRAQPFAALPALHASNAGCIAT